MISDKIEEKKTINFIIDNIYYTQKTKSIVLKIVYYLLYELVSRDIALYICRRLVSKSWSSHLSTLKVEYLTTRLLDKKNNCL
jgi:hypothetical protein